MNIVETALIFAGIPLGVVAVVTFCVYFRAETTSGVRYRPGKPWDHAPVWYVPHPQGSHAESELAAIESGHSAVPAEAVGGASGEW